MKVTGERVVSPTGGFNPTWQRHVAAYELRAVPGPGRVLDLGCGVGHSFHLLAPRESVGVDIDPGALAGQDRETVVADMRELPFGTALRVGARGPVDRARARPRAGAGRGGARPRARGVAVFVTPNRLTLGRPDEIIDPYHYVEFDPGELRRPVRATFAEVELRGLFGSPRYMELFGEERATLDRLLRLDPLRLRRLVPRGRRQRLYDGLLRRFRRAHDPRAEAIDTGRLRARGRRARGGLDLCAFCRRRDRRCRPSRSSRARRCAWCGAPLDDTRSGCADDRCARCGAATTDPWPRRAGARRGLRRLVPAPGAASPSPATRAAAHTRAAGGRIDRIAPAGPVLDVGAGEGVLRRRPARRGREAWGSKRDSDAPTCATAARAEVEGDWAAVVFWHSLEHLPEPGEAIRRGGSAARARRRASSIAVPNSASLQAQAFGDRWLHLDLPLPPRPPSRARLATAARETRALRVERVSHVRGGQIVIGWLDGLVGTLPGRPRPLSGAAPAGGPQRPLTPGDRAARIAAGVVLLPVALAGAAVEVALRRSGTVYVEARLA